MNVKMKTVLQCLPIESELRKIFGENYSKKPNSLFKLDHIRNIFNGVKHSASAPGKFNQVYS